MDAKAREMMRAEADGQVAWSWSPDAGIKPVERLTGDGGYKPGTPARA